jgi:hypothetical protein
MALRTWGRVADEYGNLTWVEVVTDSNGMSDAVWVTALIQALKLNINESPFNSNYGINARQSIVTQIFPDFYVTQTQRQFSQYFASLLISKVQGTIDPTYNVSIITHSGAKIMTQIAT